ncbi:acetolactate decarboxylase [Eubacteriaceae bacterium ES3]|nr:acetolactate decarboxylase [Eubacteriaceae bacterium ES3]
MDQNVLYQFSTLEAFTNKGYDGKLTIERLKKFGDTGLGTFNGLDGELMLIDGQVYQADGDCFIKAINNQKKIPFAVMGFLEVSENIVLKSLPGMKECGQALDQAIAGDDPIVLAVLRGDFPDLILHSVWPQEKPYQSLSEIVSKQKVVKLKRQKGTMIGIRCPLSAKGRNVVGWHFHYISDDKTIGGHVNDFKSSKLTIKYSIKSQMIELLANS